MFGDTIDSQPRLNRHHGEASNRGLSSPKTKPFELVRGVVTHDVGLTVPLDPTTQPLEESKITGPASRAHRLADDVVDVQKSMTRLIFR